MNAKETLERLPFIEAFANGEVVDYKVYRYEGWKQAVELETILLLNIGFLRIKPKPLRFKLSVKMFEGQVVDYGSRNSEIPLTKEEEKVGWRTITVEEVLEWFYETHQETVVAEWPIEAEEQIAT